MAKQTTRRAERNRIARQRKAASANNPSGRSNYARKFKYCSNNGDISAWTFLKVPAYMKPWKG
jgi:hypothetical protein